MAGPHGDAVDGLHGGVGNRDCIGAQRQRLDEIRRLAQTAGDDERDIATLQAIKMAPRPSQRSSPITRKPRKNTSTPTKRSA